MFDMGGNTKPSKLNKLMGAARGSVSPEEGRKIEQNDFNIRTDGEGITYYIGDDGDDIYMGSRWRVHEIPAGRTYRGYGRSE